MSVLPLHRGKRAYTPLEKWDGKSGPFDVIIIGTGMGGMSCGAALAQYGYKVLMLEQHYIPGGFTHMFGRKGFHWDVGVHAIGEMQPGKTPRKLLDWLSNSSIKMVSLGDPFDRFVFPDGFEFELPQGRLKYIDSLKKLFPEQEEGITRYFDTVVKAMKSSMSFFALKTMSEGIDKLGSGLKSVLQTDYWGKTTTEVLDECGIEGKLRTLLTVHWGYYGTIPDESSFAMHALTHVHFWNGAFYPEGGSKSIASALLGVILDAGGEVLTKARVECLLTEGKKVTGVKLSDGREVLAPKVVSAAGAKTTVNKLISEEWKESKWASEVSKIKSSPPYLCLNLGFEGDIASLGASAANKWLFDTWDNNQYFWDLNNPDEEPHILYCSFPSLKDPLYDPGPRQKHTGECVTFLPWSWFKQWENTDWGERGEEYLALKKRIEDKLLASLRKAMPELMEKLVLWELSTPLSAKWFTQADEGAIYGLESTPARYNCKALRTRTPYKNFYMTGVDVASLGVVGAMSSGVLTAATLDKRVYKHLL
ncbi:MAG: NAD(P)/FAD-dependent oxidoreductase [Bacteroidia bacterium]|nr:NAD(P)/FAD-dependent oxidoreductase [Bacteroidia bacterium]